MYWKSPTYNNTKYDLTHLNPFEFTFIQEAKKTKPAKEYNIRVKFGMHCFTRGKGKNESEMHLFYKGDLEERIFCFERYNLSKDLPNIICNLNKCFHASKGCYFTIKLINDAGEAKEYEIYFDLSKSKKKGCLDLYVRSAYIARDRGVRKRKQTIKFEVCF